MEINVNEYAKGYNFIIRGVSYIAKPKNNTVMYVGKKLSDMLINLLEYQNILCFTDECVDVPVDITKDNAIIKVRCPSFEYAKVARRVNNYRVEEEKRIKYQYTNGSYISETAIIGKGAVIEPGSFIGHNVVIGDNAVILTGAVIKYSVIGTNFLANEGALIGTNAYTMTDDENGNKIRIPSLGRVIIGNDVEVGSNCNISRGSVSETIIEDYVKIDSMVHIGHDVFVSGNTEIAAGTIIGGFANIGENVFLGLNVTLKNRINIEADSLVGMGAAVMKSFPEGVTIAGNPAKGIWKKT